MILSLSLFYVVNNVILPAESAVIPAKSLFPVGQLAFPSCPTRFAELPNSLCRVAQLRTLSCPTHDFELPDSRKRVEQITKIKDSPVDDKLFMQTNVKAKIGAKSVQNPAYFISHQQR